jgi:hypothetical protein
MGASMYIFKISMQGCPVNALIARWSEELGITDSHFQEIALSRF